MSGGVEANITTAANWFIGEKRDFQHAIVQEDGSPQNITGWTLEVVLRDDPLDAVPVMVITPEITNAVGGVCEWTVTAEDSLKLYRPRTLHYALYRTDAGNEAIIAYGTAVLQKSAAP